MYQMLVFGPYLSTDFDYDVYRVWNFVAVKMTHRPSGRSAACSEFPTEWENRMKAWELLKPKLHAGEEPM